MNHPVILWIETNLRCDNRTKRFAGKKVKITDWQKDLIHKVWPASNNFQRIVEEILICHCRKDGKTAFLSFLYCYFLFAKDSLEGLSHIKHASPSMIQSKILFQIIISVIKNSKLPADILKDGEVKPKGNERTFEILSGEMGTKQGLNFDILGCDESDKTDFNMVDMLQGGQALADPPLSIFLTNPPEQRTSWIVPKIDYGRKVLSGEVKDDSFVASIYESTQAEANDYKNPAVWRKANPSFKTITPESYYIREIKKIKNTPEKLPNWQRLFLGCHSYANAESWLSPERVKPIPKEVDLKKLKWIGGLDGATTRDIVSFVLLSQDASGNLYIKAFNWIPLGAFQRREDRNIKQIKRFLKHKDKSLFISDHEAVTFQEISDKISEIRKQGYRFSKVGVDRSRHILWHNEIKCHGIEYLAFSTQKQQQDALISFLENQIIHGKVFIDPESEAIFKWSMSNTRMGKNPPAQTPCKYFQKTASKDSIDTIMGTLFATGVLMKDRPKRLMPSVSYN